MLLRPTSVPPDRFYLQNSITSALHRKWNLLYYADDAKDIIGVTHVEDSHWTKHELKRNASMKTKPTIDFSKPLKKGNMYTVKVYYSVYFGQRFLRDKCDVKELSARRH